ncbi:hypothetical protein GCM10011497_36780 [Elstera cyanobacteriorum]|uniref:SMODS and SLOG-associating 2TM effector domain-containing protein n=1 Tax=Elstera cyanobacteriorum TaxID=2022747 RepID=A0A255XY22_9PROT|nr:DUF4231 domain-containing protein [Elstera cyanobacteriorum]OYQ21878.1 hypothetical protein CHR90_00880 [Elstera cyanobacteriorum]GGA02762.1 hypothetical protein GCM10011497_36780 [Elstera cyanobacteriorum]
MTNSIIPLLDRLAERQAELSATGNHLKRRLESIRLTCFGLSITGAALAAVAGGLPSDAGRAGLTWTATGMLALGTFLTARMLGQDAVAQHVTARMASEALKREAFLYATGADPYSESSTRDQLLADRIEAVEITTEGLALQEQKAQGTGTCPRGFLDAAAYMTSRVDEQIAFYRKTADRLTLPSRLLHRAEFLLAGAAAVITAVAATTAKGGFDLAALTAVITTVAGTVLAHGQAARYDALIISYRITARRLAHLKATQSPEAGAAEIAAAAEAIIAAETKSWQALWLKEERPKA